MPAAGVILRPIPGIAPADLRLAGRVLVMDAAWASLTGALSGGVVIAAFVLYLGATPSQLGALASLTLLAQAAQLPAIALVHRVRRRKQIVVLTLTAARLAIPALALLALLPPGDAAIAGLMAAQLLITALGSVAGYLCTEGEQKVVGLEVNAHHIRSVRSGRVRGVCKALHIGSRHQVWQIEIFDEQRRLCCSSRLTTAVV